MSWVRIRRTRIKVLSDRPWLVKRYPDDARSYFDFDAHTRVETFEQAIDTADRYLGKTNENL